MRNKTLLLALFMANFSASAEDMPVIYVSDDEGRTSTDISSQTVNKTQLDNSISGNGFLGSVIDINANIEVKDSSKNSKTAGEIKPGEISINEAPSYQNNFMIDGASNNSLLDPLLNNNFSRYDVPGNDSEMFLDIDLIEQIKVFDSGISAEYGGFLGGVIEVQTIRAAGEPTFKASYRTTGDKFTNIHIVEGKEEGFEKATTHNQQPRFDKQFYKLNFTTPLGDSDGLVIGYNKKTSIIPGAYFDGFKDLKRENHNLLLKWSHYFDNDSILDVSATYAPYEATYIQQYVKDSDVLTKGGGYSLNLNYEADFGFFDSKTSLSYRNSENSRDAHNYYKSWIFSDTKNWGRKRSSANVDYSIEGANGSITKEQKSLTLSSKYISHKFDALYLKHKLKTGFGFDYSQATYMRESDLTIYKDSSVNALVDCNGNSEDCEQNQQYFKHRNIYKKEDTTADIFAGSFYVEDVMNYNDFELVAGVNISYDNYLNNLNLSPRLNSQYKLTQTTTLFGGANRYSGKSFLGYKLRESRVPYYQEERSTFHNTVTPWETSSVKDNRQYIFSDLKTPYTDELSLGIRQDMFNNRIILKYVGRDSKDMFTTTSGDPEVFTLPNSNLQGYYTPTYMSNNGKSTADIISLNISSFKPYKTSYFDMGYKFSTAWKKSTSNVTDYSDDATQESDDGYVYYNGSFHKSDALPIQEKKQLYNFHLNFKFKEFELFGVRSVFKWNNILHHNSKFSKIVKRLGEKKLHVITFPDGSTKESEVGVYNKVTYEPTTILNMKLSIDMRLSGKSKINLSTEINNVFDEIVLTDSNTRSYELGRQFWFEASYIF